MGVAHRFGESGRARTEDEDRLGCGRHSARRGPGPTVGERVDRSIVQPGHVVRLEHIGQQGRGVAVRHGVDRARQVEGVLDLGRLPGRAEEDGRRPQLADGVDGDHEFHPVGRHQRDPIACRDPLGRQMARQCIAQTVKIAKRPRGVATADSDAIAETVSGSLEALVHQRRCHWKHSSLN